MKRKTGWPKLKRFFLIWSFAASAVFFVVLTASAEVVDTAWVRRYDGPGNNDDYARAIAVDRSGNVYVTGESGGRWTGYDYATIKYYANGDTAWVRRYNGPAGVHDYAEDISVDGSGNVYVTGSSYGGATRYDYATIKYGPDGQVLWAKRYNGATSGYDYASAIVVDAFGNVYVTGHSYRDTTTQYDYATIKYDPNGNQLWVRIYDGPANAWDYAYALCVDSSGDVYVAGASYGSGTYRDYATIKYHSDGTRLWVRRYDGPASEHDYAKDITIDGSGNVCVTGYSYGSGGTSHDYATIKYDTDGSELWVRRYNGPASGYDSAFAVGADFFGNVYVTGASYGGETYSDYATVKYDSDGNQLWVRRYNGPANHDDYASALSVGASGNVYVTGTSYGSGSFGDYATVKYSPEGTELWVKRYNGTEGMSDEASAIAVDDSGNVYVTGIAGSDTLGGKSEPAALTSGDYATIKYVSLNPDFAVQVSPDRSTLCAGDSTTFEVDLTSVDGFDSPCTLSVSGLPSAVGWEFFPPQVVPSGNAVLTLWAADSIVSGTHELGVIASGGSKIHGDSTYLTTSNPPVLYVPDMGIFRVGRQGTLWVAAADADTADTLSLSTPFESGTFQQTDSLGGDASGLFTWIPESADTAGSPYQVAFEVSDHHCRTQSETTILSVVSNYAPVFEDCPPHQIACLGDTVKFTISASDADAGDLLTLYMLSGFGSFPSGRQGVGNVAGEFVWVPDTADTEGTHYAEFLVTDQRQAQDTCSVAIEVRTNSPPEISLDPPFSDTTIHEGQTLVFRVTAEDPDEDSIVLSALDVPLNATLTDSGTGAGSFSFTPDFTQAGTYYMTFIASDTRGLADTVQCTIIVLEFNLPPEIHLPFSDTSIYEGQTLEFGVSAEDPDGGPVVLDASDVPSNASFVDSGNGAGSFTFLPDFTQADIYHQTFIASDTGGLTDTEQCTIAVLNFNRPPEIQLLFSDTTIHEKDTLEFEVLAEDPDGDTQSFHAYNLPEGAWFNSVTAVFCWTPEWGQLGEYDSILFEVGDGVLADSQYAKITVKNRTLEVREHHPGPNEEDVLIDTDISITLSEPIDFLTVDSNTFVVKSRIGGILKGTYIYTESSPLLGFLLPPDSMFSTSDTIAVTLTTQIKDWADSGMAEPYSWEFLTGLGVYPGNTNNDTTVDERDILPLGFYWGETGPARDEKYQNTSWSIKPVHTQDPNDPASKWDPASAVYADADGSGTVDAQDICAVADNWESKISASPQDFEEGIKLSKEHRQELLSIYETIYHALLNCPESKGKNQIRKFLEEILEEKKTPSRFEVSQNYPNPFNATTVIRYSLPWDCQVEVRLFNILGQAVRTLVNEYQTSGHKRVVWDGKDDRGEDVGSGIYFLQVKAESLSHAQKMVLLR